MHFFDRGWLFWGSKFPDLKRGSSFLGSFIEGIAFLRRPAFFDMIPAAGNIGADLTTLMVVIVQYAR